MDGCGRLPLRSGNRRSGTTASILNRELADRADAVVLPLRSHCVEMRFGRDGRRGVGMLARGINADFRADLIRSWQRLAVFQWLRRIERDGVGVRDDADVLRGLHAERD